MMTKLAYRASEGTKPVTVRYATARGSLGRMLVARTPDGVCAVLFGDDAATLATDLADRFPHAEVREDATGLSSTVAAVRRRIDAAGDDVDLPLDLRGTEFQRRVWRALQEIPAGRTASYSAIATRIGAPRAVRAVARACAANPLAVLVPCHRVVRADGGLSGYRWGIERKRALLAREAGR